MCGIVGLIDRAAPGRAVATAAAMNETIVHRGPDGDGAFAEGSIAIAMRRLSVIDLEGGWQPLFSRGDAVVAFQNGEIYNHRALRTELERAGHAFTTASDTEVLAHGFAEWGMRGLLERIDGMYAIAILDRGTNRLWLARDRFGEKPLFFTADADRFAWASSMRAIVRSTGMRAIDPRGLDAYLALHFVPGDRTILEGVCRVLPGEMLEVDVETLAVRRERYYRLPVGTIVDRPNDEIAERIEASVRSRLIADVPVGVFLSGGLDSSLIAAMAARHTGGIDTFSMGFASDRHDESRFAKLVAEAIGSRHHHFLFDESRFLDFIPIVTAALDEPLGDPAMLPLHWLCREAREHVTVALAGEGADEIFAGYNYYRPVAPAVGLAERWRARKRRRRPRADRLIAHDLRATPSGFPVVADRALRRRLMPGAVDDTPDAFERYVDAVLADAADPLQRATAADMLTWLPDDLLVKFDRMAMAHSLEGRAPFLEPSIVEAGLQLPAVRKMTQRTSKIALRDIARPWLPDAILDRDKHGFVLPVADWIGSWYAQFGGAADYLRSRECPGLDRDATTTFIERDLADGVRASRLQFALIVLLEWYADIAG